MEWRQIIAQWVLLEMSFQSVLHIDLEDVWHVKSWRWFSVRVRALLLVDSPLKHHFAPPPPDPKTPEVFSG